MASGIARALTSLARPIANISGGRRFTSNAATVQGTSSAP